MMHIDPELKISSEIKLILSEKATKFQNNLPYFQKKNNLNKKLKQIYLKAYSVGQESIDFSSTIARLIFVKKKPKRVFCPLSAIGYFQKS